MRLRIAWPLPAYEPMRTDFPDEEESAGWNMFFDGASNQKEGLRNRGSSRNILLFGSSVLALGKSSLGLPLFLLAYLLAFPQSLSLA
ncbi:hypothetical protein Q3G72_012724 [Acer saccharum]|nr:hypothetical protein Q3G72_012724 [Acer saccharum]